MLVAALSLCCFGGSSAFVSPPSARPLAPLRTAQLTTSSTSSKLKLAARRRGDGEEGGKWGEEDEEGDYYQRRGASGRPSADSGEEFRPVPQMVSMGKRGMAGFTGNISKALVAGIFVLGIGTGVTVDSAINTNPRDLASRDAIDRNAPNPNICQTYGSSAMVVDQRVFVTFNPFSIHVTQADVKPGCVLRPSNVQEVLQRRGLLTEDEVQVCKNGMNTWAYVGDLGKKPQLSCVYQSDDAQNEFLSDPRLGLGEDYEKYGTRSAASRSAAGQGAAASQTAIKSGKLIKAIKN
jgi:hypothetical protein